MPAAAGIEGLLRGWIASKPTAAASSTSRRGAGRTDSRLRRTRTCSSTLLDWPNVLVHTRKTASSSLAVDASRVKYLEGNLFELDWKGPYDVVLLSQIYHHFDSTTRRLRGSRGRQQGGAPAPGGKIVVHDLISDDVKNPPAGRHVQPHDADVDAEGEAYALRDYEKWFSEWRGSRSRRFTASRACQQACSSPRRMSAANALLAQVVSRRAA